MKENMLALTLYQKSILATALLAIAFLQLMVMAAGRGWIGGYSLDVRRRLIQFHRFEGYIGFIIILLVAYNCVFNVGVRIGSARIAVHSLLGITVISLAMGKILINRGLRRYYPRLPLLGALLLAALIGIWIVSAGWYLVTQSAGYGY